MNNNSTIIFYGPTGLNTVKKILLLSVFLLPFILFGQVQDTIVDLTETCIIYQNEVDKPFTIEVDNHEVRGTKGKYAILKAIKNEHFLNVYCLHERTNLIKILTSRKENDEWKHYASFQIIIPKYDIKNTIKNIEYPDINTVYIVYETKEKELLSYVIKLTEHGYSIYQFLNDPFPGNELYGYKYRKFKGRPKF